MRKENILTPATIVTFSAGIAVKSARMTDTIRKSLKYQFHGDRRQNDGSLVLKRMGGAKFVLNGRRVSIRDDDLILE